MRHRLLLVLAAFLVWSTVINLEPAPVQSAEPPCAVDGTAYQPRQAEAAAALEQAGAGAANPPLPALRKGLAPAETQAPGTVPCVLLKAISYVESSWRQARFTVPEGSTGPALMTPSCSYGMMQITSGMRRPGELPADVQMSIASDYRFNTGWGAKMLADLWNNRTIPAVGDRDPNIAENWYYVVWAYHSWSSANNPNSPDFPWPRPPFTGSENRTNYPYQEIVWGLAANPPKRNGQLMWQPIALTLPRREDVGLPARALPVFPSGHAAACSAPAGGMRQIMIPWITRRYRP